MPADVVGVVPDVPAVARELHYRVPGGLAPEVGIGAIVRIPLQGRRVRGWVVEVNAEPPPGVKLRPLAKVTGLGPTAELLALADWAAWRWAGNRVTFLRAASPERAVRRLPAAPAVRATDHAEGADRADTGPSPVTGSEQTAMLREAFAGGTRALRWPPAADPYPIVAAAAAQGQALILTPGQDSAAWLAARLRADGVAVAHHPDGWADAAAGATVIGSRAAAWAPAPNLSAVVVLDCHDERYQSERAPTWDAVDVVIERARRRVVPCVLASPAPPLEHCHLPRLAAPVIAPSRAAERNGWPALHIIDRRQDDPRTGLYSPAFVRLLREGRSLVAVLNRVGRAKLLACSRCGELARCEACSGPMRAGAAPSTAGLVCGRCGAGRPEVCLACGTTRLAVVRPGVGRAREELEALAGRPVCELTAATPRAVTKPTGVSPTRDLAPGDVVVGTEAVLHRLRRADVVAFLDFDQHLLAPRYRASEEAMALLILAARLVGGRKGGGQVLVQTRAPAHEVLQAALHADPARLAAAEAGRRLALGYPPFRALALVEGAGAAALGEALSGQLGVEVLGPRDGAYLVRAADDAALADALAAGALATPAPPARVEVGPRRV